MNFRNASHWMGYWVGPRIDHASKVLNPNRDSSIKRVTNPDLKQSYSLLSGLTQIIIHYFKEGKFLGF